MKLTYSKILHAETALETFQQQRLPIRTLYKLSRLANAISTEMDFYRKKMRDIIDEYSAKDENGNPIQDGANISIQPDKIEECNAQINELLYTEVELPDIKIKLEELEKIDATIDTFNSLLPFIEE